MNYGLDLEKEINDRQETDYVFGSGSTPCYSDFPVVDTRKYLPVGEVQVGKEDMMDCASRGPENILETKLTYLYQNALLKPKTKVWLEMNGYIKDGRVVLSDAYTAIKSGTTRKGNSLKAPLQAIHEWGIIPKHMLPLLPSMSFEEYHDPKRITAQMERLGKESVQIFEFEYERVMMEDKDELLKKDILDSAGFAWPLPTGGVYPQSSRSANHCFVTFRDQDIVNLFAFDNYIDDDGDFIKELAHNYELLNYGYRLYITTENDPYKKDNWIADLLKRLFLFK